MAPRGGCLKPVAAVTRPISPRPCAAFFFLAPILIDQPRRDDEFAIIQCGVVELAIAEPWGDARIGEEPPIFVQNELRELVPVELTDCRPLGLGVVQNRILDQMRATRIGEHWKDHLSQLALTVDLLSRRADSGGVARLAIGEKNDAGRCADADEQSQDQCSFAFRALLPFL